MRIYIIIALFLLFPIWNSYAGESKDHRGDSSLFFGITTPRVLAASVTPYNVGMIFGDSAMVAIEYGKGSFTVSSFSLFDGFNSQQGEYVTKGGYLRAFTGNSFNFFFGLFKRTWQGDFTFNIQSCTFLFACTTTYQVHGKMFVETKVASLGIGNQWQLHPGITIGGDWVIGSVLLGSSKETSASDNQTDPKYSKQALDNLDELSDDAIRYSTSPSIVMTLGWAF